MGHCQLIVLSVVFCVVVVQGQLNGKSYRSSARGSCLACTKLCVFYTVVFATWNGTRITGPVLIYHDEIIVDPTRSLGVLTVHVPFHHSNTLYNPKRSNCIERGFAALDAI